VLPPGWRSWTSKESSEVFFQNTSTGQIQKERPHLEIGLGDVVVLTRLCIGIRQCASGDFGNARVAFESASQAALSATQLLAAAARSGIEHCAILYFRQATSATRHLAAAVGETPAGAPRQPQLPETETEPEPEPEPELEPQPEPSPQPPQQPQPQPEQQALDPVPPDLGPDADSAQSENERPVGRSPRDKVTFTELTQKLQLDPAVSLKIHIRALELAQILDRPYEFQVPLFGLPLGCAHHFFISHEQASGLGAGAGVILLCHFRTLQWFSNLHINENGVRINVDSTAFA
jgi:hypothetical protein